MIAPLTADQAIAKLFALWRAEQWGSVPAGTTDAYRRRRDVQALLQEDGRTRRETARRLAALEARGVIRAGGDS